VRFLRSISVRLDPTFSQLKWHFCVLTQCGRSPASSVQSCCVCDHFVTSRSAELRASPAGSAAHLGGAAGPPRALDRTRRRPGDDGDHRPQGVRFAPIGPASAEEILGRSRFLDAPICDPIAMPPESDSAPSAIRATGPAGFEPVATEPAVLHTQTTSRRGSLEVRSRARHA
jgi:hypothetical protein